MKKQIKTAPAHRGLSIRRKEYDAVAAAFDIFQEFQRSLVIGLDNDIGALQREIALRESLKHQTMQVNKS